MNNKCIKAPETQEVLRKNIRQTFYDVHRYFVILSIEKFYDVVIHWNHYDQTIMKWGEVAWCLELF